MNLYEINENLMAAYDAAVDPETGEIIDNEKLENFYKLQIDRDEKIENICLFIKNLKADAAALKTEKDSFAARQKAAEHKAEWLTSYLQQFLNGDKWKSNRASVSYRKSEQINIKDIRDIPIEYIKFADPVPDKLAIKAAIKRGENIKGAEIVEKQNISIK